MEEFCGSSAERRKAVWELIWATAAEAPKFQTMAAMLFEPEWR